MSVSDGSTKRVAETMTDWFREVLRLCDQVFFGISTDERQRKAATMNTLARNAKILIASHIDTSGELFLPLCLVLAAACRRLDVELGVGQWRAAIENVRLLGAKLRAEERSLASLGLPPMTPAAVFKQQLDEGLVNAGVTDRPTILDQQNRLRALGLAANFGMRFLIAYALETHGEPAGRAPEARDLPWLRALLTPVTR